MPQSLCIHVVNRTDLIIHIQLQTVHGYLGLLQPIMDSLKRPGDRSEQSQLNPTIDYIGTILKRLETDLDSVQKAMDTFGGSRPQSPGEAVNKRTPKWIRVKWMLNKKATALHRNRVRDRRVELSQAVGLLQSSQSVDHSILLLDIQEVTRNGFGEVSELLTATAEASQPPSVSEDPTPSNPIAQPASYTERETDRGLIGISACLETRTSQHCHCKCHSRREVRTGDIFTQAIGQIFLNYTSIPFWDPNPTCDNPDEPCRCSLDGGFRTIRLNYIFPEWLFRKAIYLSATWEALHGSGASLHLRIARVVPYSHMVWTAMERNAMWQIQAMLDSKDILPTDIDTKGNTLFYVR